MYSTVRRFLLPFLCCLTAALLALATWCAVGYAYADDAAPEITVASANDGTLGSTTNVNSQFNNSEYKNLFQITSSMIAEKSCNGGGTINNAFDNNIGTYWTSQQANTEEFKNRIVVKFTETLKFKDLMYKSSFYSRDDGRHFSGYPTTLNIYAANGNDNYALVGTCVSEPEENFSETVVFSLPKGVDCDRIIIEFAEVSVFSEVESGRAVAVVRDFTLFKSNEGIYITKKGTGNHADAAYLSYNGVSSDEMKIRANGGGTISNAFDKSASTYWTSESYNTDEFTNKVTLTMNTPQTISNIVYACSYYTRTNGRNFSGFPTEFTVTVTDSDGEKTVYTFIGTPGSDWTHADFAFPEAVTCKKLELEFTKLTTFSEIANGNPVVSTGEIYLVKSNSEAAEAMIARINGVFTDYAQYEISDGITIDDINEMREEAKYLSNYEQALKPIIDRAEAILTGSMRKDPYREFSTDPNAKNPIEQYGDLQGYCTGTLQMSSFGTNRQVIGIGGTTGETITIYVEADEGDPLPQVAFTQIYGAWNSWLRTYELHRGKNEIVFPNFKSGGSYTQAVAAGGPIHIINPYTPAQQSSNVKLYFEGGYVYPVFHDGDDEGTFRVILKDYYERLNDPKDTSITIDAFEAVTNNVILSCSATLAYNSYVKNGTSPQYNIDKWRTYTIDTLKFGGVVFDKDEEHYDERNLHIRCNYRSVQPYAGMYAFAAWEHIGIIDSATFPAMVQKWTVGWAFYHEMGHQLDNKRMKIAEVTNNMWAIYNVYMIDGSIADRINVTNVSKNLASDFSGYVGNYWYNDNSNCDFWWILEGACPGYWARLQQLYNFEYNSTDLDKAITNSVERLCYYSSLAIGEDCSSYFERFGFYFNLNKSQKFTKAGASQAFNNAMNDAKARGKIKNTNKKYWYVNNGQYRQIRAHDKPLEDWGSCYNSSQTVAPLKIMGSSGSYTLLLPTPQNSEAHLCYEIQSYINGEWKVMGVTDGTSFNDTYAYGSSTPQYRVYAYDRLFNHTGDPEPVSPHTSVQTNVCRIGDTYYDTLSAAVNAANNTSGSDAITIYLLKDFEDGNINISRSNGIVILPDAGVESVTITKNAPGHLINMVWHANIGSATAPIILDGGKFSQSGSLIRTQAGKFGRITLTNITLQNNINTGNGGAIVSESGTYMDFNNVTIKDNSAANGGGIYTTSYVDIGVRGKLTVTGNVATGNGGGIYAGNGDATFQCYQVSSAYPEVVISGNRAANGGGVYAEKTTLLNNAQIKNNTATQNGGGVYSAAASGRYLRLTDCTVQDNEAVMGDAIYMYCGTTRLAGVKVCGMIFKNYGTSPATSFELHDALSDFSESEIRVSKTIPLEGLKLCDAVTGIAREIITEPAKTYPVYNGRAEYVYQVGIVAYPTTANVTIKYGAESFQSEVPYGSFTLPDRFEDLPAGTYIEKYTIGGEEYSVGQSVPVTGDFTATAVVKNYCTVTLIYGTYSEKYTLKQGVTYYLPMKTKDNEVVFGWDCSDGNYYAYAEGVLIERDTVFNAVIKRLHTVVTVIEGIETTAQYEYNGSVTLTSPPNIFGKVFSHWEIDGKKYQPNQTLKVTRDFVATAVYTDSWTVTTIVEDDETTETYANGAQITLEPANRSLGREFKYWLINNVKYYAGSTYTVTRDSEIVAVFAQVNTANDLTVTLAVNKGALYNEDGTVKDTIVETVNTELTYAFNATHTFTKPDVNPGNEFLYWDVNGVKYYPGDRITVTEAFTATAAVAKATSGETDGEITVTVKDYVGNALTTTQYKYAANSSVYLAQPSATPDGKAFSHFDVTVDGNTERHEAGETITVTQATQIEAKYDVARTVTLNQKTAAGAADQDTYEYGNSRKFTLPAPKSVEITENGVDKIFSHWEIGGVEYKAGDLFDVTQDTQINAVYTEIEKISVTFKQLADDGTLTEQTSREKIGWSQSLAAPLNAPAGKEFSHWEVNGVVYASGAKLIVLEDTQIVAVYNDVEVPSDPDNPDNSGNGGSDTPNTPGSTDNPNTPDNSGSSDVSGNGGDDNKGGSKTGLIVGIIVAVVVVLGGAAVAVIIVLKKKKQKPDAPKPAPEKKSAQKKAAPSKESKGAAQDEKPANSANTAAAKPAANTAATKPVETPAAATKTAATASTAKTAAATKTAAAKPATTATPAKGKTTVIDATPTAKPAAAAKSAPAAASKTATAAPKSSGIAGSAANTAKSSGIAGSAAGKTATAAPKSSGIAGSAANKTATAAPKSSGIAGSAANKTTTAAKPATTAKTAPAAKAAEKPAATAKPTATKQAEKPAEKPASPKNKK